MTSSGVGSLHFIEGKVDRTLYLDILKMDLKISAHIFGLEDRFSFSYDNDPKHFGCGRRKVLVHLPKKDPSSTSNHQT